LLRLIFEAKRKEVVGGYKEIAQCDLYFTANDVRLIKYKAYRMGEECGTQVGVKNCLKIYGENV